MNCPCFDELPLPNLADRCEVEIVKFDSQESLIVQIRCPHGRVRRHSIARHTADFEWFTAAMLQHWVTQQRRCPNESVNHKPGAVAA
jgi:hypothetical protein